MTKKNDPKRGRPRSFDIDEALDTALTLFHERGYDGVGVAELSTELGIRPPSLYAAFGNKAGLFAAVIDRYSEKEGGFVAEAFSGSASVADGLRRMFMMAATIYSRGQGQAGCLVMEGSWESREADARQTCLAKRCRTRDAIRDFIASESPAKAEHIADQAMIILSGLSSSARADMDDKALKAFAGMAADGLASMLAD